MSSVIITDSAYQNPRKPCAIEADGAYRRNKTGSKQVKFRDSHLPHILNNTYNKNHKQ
jgi:hypothetical protein